MNSFIKTSIKRPVTVCILIIILLSAGVLATLDMSTNLLPNIALPMLGVTVVYPGAGAQSVQNDVTSLLEDALKTVPGVTQLETVSYDNVGVAIVYFDYGTDIDQKSDVIEDKLKTVSFPSGCNEPSLVNIDLNGTATATVAVYNTSDDANQLKQNADDLAQKFRAIDGVGSVEVLGTSEKQIRVTALQGLDVTSLLLVQALSKENLNLPLGTVMQDGTSISIRNASDATSVLEVMQIPVELQLGSGTLSSVTTLKNGVKTFATCTLQQFENYVQKARDARRVMEEIEGKTADELAENQNNLTSIKSLMSVVRENTSQSLRLMWRTIDNTLLQNEEFVNMTDDDLQVLADQTGLSQDLLKWLRDESKVPEGETEAPLKQDWYKLVDFRAIFPTADSNDDGVLDGNDITYQQFATLFQDGGSVTVPLLDENGNPLLDEQGNAQTQEKTYQGLDLLHSETSHQNETEPCDRKTFTAQQAEDVCRFADSVNTLAYADIVETVRTAEEKANNGETVETPIISDAQFAALFVNSEQGNDFAALLSPQVIHVIRQENFDNGEGSVVDVLTQSKQAHVDENGNPVYKNGVVFTENDDGKAVVNVAEKQLFVNNFGRLTDEKGNLVDENGNILQLSDQQIAENYYTYGSWLIFTDQEFLDLYSQLNLDVDLGVKLTADTTRFLRICNFSENVNTLIVPVAYVGRVEERQDEQSYAQYNGLLAATVKVYAVADANTTKVVQNVKKVIAQNSFESDVLLLDDNAQFITDSISNVLTSIIIGGVLAVLVIYLFVRKIGSSLVISVTMPLSVLVALLGLWAMDITLNMVSLGGLAVGIGMLVDNSIVVLESITKHRDGGESVFDSCLNGTREVAGSLLASTLTNVCVFFPILFAKGLTREIFYDLVWAVIFSIVMSLLVAVTAIPSLYHLIYKKPRVRRKQKGEVNCEDLEPRARNAHAPKTTVTKGKRKTGGKIYALEQGYGKVLGKVLSKRVLVCVVALAVFGASVLLVFTTGTEFLPSVDKGLVEINMTFQNGATLQEIKEAGVKAADAVSQRYGEGVQYVSLTVGKQGMLATNVTNVLRVQLDVNKLNTEQTVQEIRALLANQNLNAKSVSVRAMDGVVAEVTGGMAGQSVTLLSDDMDALAQAASKVAEKLKTVEGIATVTDKTAPKTQQISFVFNKDECAKRGVDYQNAVLMLRVGLSGYTAANVSVEGQTEEVIVQFDETTSSLEELTNVVVGFDENGTVLLKDVLKTDENGNLYTTDYVVSVVDKKDGKFVTTVEVESFGADTGTMSKRISAAVAEVLADYPTVEYREGGVAAYLTDAFNGLVVSLIAAFLLLYGVMACQFESLLKPFVVIMSIPFSFTGGFLALVITGTTLNVVSFVGIIMLMGVIVNGAIVMIDKINLLISEGMPAQQAVVEGCKSRLRPILMTTLTTVLALVPLALGLGRGGELMQPMGIVVIGGLLLGTLVTLVLIPCFYCIVKRISFQNYNGGGTTENAIATTENAAERATANPSATETANTATATDSTADVATPSAN